LHEFISYLGADDVVSPIALWTKFVILGARLLGKVCGELRRFSKVIIVPGLSNVSEKFV
jgi:hypothetical protein